MNAVSILPEGLAIGVLTVASVLGSLVWKLCRVCRERARLRRENEQLRRETTIARRDATGLRSELGKVRTELKLLRNTEGQTQRDADLVVAWMLRLLTSEKDTTKRELS